MILSPHGSRPWLPVSGHHLLSAAMGEGPPGESFRQAIRALPRRKRVSPFIGELI